MNTVKYSWWALTLFFPLSILAQSPCIEGMAGGFPCNNVDLLSKLSPDELLAEEKDGILINDLWGWTDPSTGKEYVLVGMANGTSFVDISDPINPTILGILPEHHSAQSARNSGGEQGGAKSLWRDIKVYQNYAFIVSEDDTHGMQVFDLTNLRNVSNPPVEFKEAGHYNEIGSAHNIVINEATGYAYAVGSGGSTSVCGGKGLHIINIQNPTSPTYEACFDSDGYTHDAQCVIYQGPDTDYVGKEICFNANENSVTVVNVDDKNNIQMISRNTYSGSAYTHQGWLTEDHKYFLANDELDEYNNGTNTKTFIWDIQDLDAPVLIGAFEHPTTAIDHNLYVVGNRVYESNYTSGLRILDISDIANANLTQLGFFDTYPTNDNPDFKGTWSNYPFFSSGVVAVSDITNGLFLLKPYSEAFITQQPENMNACTGDQLDLPIEVTGGTLSYQWQIDRGTGFEDITDNVSYENITSKILRLNEVSFSQNQYRFRCEITTPNEIYYTNPATLEVTDNTTANFEYSMDSNIVTFTNISYAADSYLWNFGDGSDNDILESPEHIYSYEAMNYTVSLTSSNACSSNVATQDISIAITGLEPDNPGPNLNLYPLPASMQITIESDLTHNNTLFTIYTNDGKAVLNGTLTKGRKTIDVSKLDRGIYFIKVQFVNDGTLTQRMIIK
jgi:choice-of-anchor B domain-containing protein